MFLKNRRHRHRAAAGPHGRGCRDVAGPGARRRLQLQEEDADDGALVVVAVGGAVRGHQVRAQRHAARGRREERRRGG